MSIEEQTYNLLNKTLEVVQALPEATKWISLITDLKNRCNSSIINTQVDFNFKFLLDLLRLSILFIFLKYDFVLV